MRSQVHRGVYVAAEILYERFKPMVEEQLASSPFAKVAFTVSPSLLIFGVKYILMHIISMNACTSPLPPLPFPSISPTASTDLLQYKAQLEELHLQGHSLGGSLGTLLMMMYKYRGVLPQSAIAPVYTFGAPAIFCEGACCAPCQADTELCSVEPTQPAAAVQGQTAAAAVNTSATEPVTDNHGHLKSQGILQALGLEAGAVRNIFMNRDIVPRAFACDYTLVADLLRRVGEGFREHGCLMGEGRSALVTGFSNAACSNTCSLWFWSCTSNRWDALQKHVIHCNFMWQLS